MSWCKTEFIVTDPKMITCIDYNAEPQAPKTSPPLVVMSLNMRTIVNEKKNVNEIVSLSALVYNKGILSGYSKE